LPPVTVDLLCRAPCIIDNRLAPNTLTSYSLTTRSRRVDDPRKGFESTAKTEPFVRGNRSGRDEMVSEDRFFAARALAGLGVTEIADNEFSRKVVRTKGFVMIAKSDSHHQLHKTVNVNYMGTEEWE